MTLPSSPGADDDARLFVTLGDLLERVVYECDTQGRPAIVSDWLTVLTGRAVGQAPLDQLCVPEDQERVRAARAAVGVGARLVLRYRLATSSGPPVPVEDVAEARPSPGGVRLVGAIEDLRARHRAEALLVERTWTDAVSQLAGGVAHEVNNALSGVLNYAQLAQRCPPGDVRHLPEALDGILSEGRRILEMTRSLLVYTRSTQPRSLQVADLLRAAVAPARLDLRDELVSVVVDAPSEVPPVEAIGHELIIVLRHAIGWSRAALRARGKGKKTLTLRARFDEATSRVTIDVSDAAASLSRAAEDPDLQVEVERSRALLEKLGGRLEVAGDGVRLVLPVV